MRLVALVRNPAPRRVYDTIVFLVACRLASELFLAPIDHLPIVVLLLFGKLLCSGSAFISFDDAATR